MHAGLRIKELIFHELIEKGCVKGKKEKKIPQQLNDLLLIFCNAWSY